MVSILHPPGTVCILLLHEPGHCYGPSPDPLSFVTCAQGEPPLICENHRAPVVDLSILVFCGILILK